MTFNEINMSLQSLSTCSGAMRDHSLKGLDEEQLTFEVVHNMLLASAKAVILVHEIAPEALAWKYGMEACVLSENCETGRYSAADI